MAKVTEKAAPAALPAPDNIPAEANQLAPSVPTEQEAADALMHLLLNHMQPRRLMLIYCQTLMPMLLPQMVAKNLVF